MVFSAFCMSGWSWQTCQLFQQLLCCRRLVYYSWWNNALIEKNTSYLQMTKCVATKWVHCGSFLVNDNASCQKDAQISPFRLEMIQGKLYLRHWQPWQGLCWFYGCFGNHSAVCVRGCLRIQTYCSCSFTAPFFRNYKTSSGQCYLF